MAGRTLGIERKGIGLPSRTLRVKTAGIAMPAASVCLTRVPQAPIAVFRFWSTLSRNPVVESHF